MFYVKPKCAPNNTGMVRSRGDEKHQAGSPMKMACYKKAQQPGSQNKEKISYRIVRNEILNGILPLSPFPVS